MKNKWFSFFGMFWVMLSLLRYHRWSRRAEALERTENDALSVAVYSLVFAFLFLLPVRHLLPVIRYLVGAVLPWTTVQTLAAWAAEYLYGVWVADRYYRTMEQKGWL